MATASATLTEKQKEFLENPFVGVATTLREDGSPHNTVVWVDVDDDGVSFNTARGRAKDVHLQADPRIALTVLDSQNPYKWVSISGRAELTEDGADPQIDRLAKKYLDKDEYPWRSPTETRVSARITPEKIDSYGFED
jgi:PPOX class probable F420-dependent enzyme